ncbi:MAG: RdgB/HAM1 family non-canonical purine NTP pyrophosphatase [Bdellovibrionales bacterium]|nr:RdgB/HAM1 family non-canonical purine NTP pyrophosphatase [Bdellovibrionales bacterium]
MELWIASSNPGKLQEMRTLLADLPITIKAQNDIPHYSSPDETGDTFIANARIKAKPIHVLRPDAWVLADDSGLECEGLNHLPGVHSARYAGPKATDKENVAKLLKMLQIRTTNRKACFKCVLVAYSPSGEEFVFDGQLNGTIAIKQSGMGGFGYDPVFIPEGQTKTLAELTSAEKNKISHRGLALRLFKDKLKQNL